MNNKIISLLSLCQKAGKLVSGEFACEKTLQKGEAQIVLVAEDASDNTKKKFVNKAFFYEVPSYVVGTKDIFSKAISKTNRAVIIINDRGFAEKIKELIDNLEV